MVLAVHLRAHPPLRNLKASLTCRVLVRLSSASEAFRLLRNLHMTNYEPDAWGDKYIIRAQLIS